MKKIIYIAFDGKEFREKIEYKKYQKEALKNTKWFNTIRTVGYIHGNNFQDHFCVTFENEDEFKQCCNFLGITNYFSWDEPGIYLVDYQDGGFNGYVIESLKHRLEIKLAMVEDFKKTIEENSKEKHGKFSYDYFERRLD